MMRRKTKNTFKYVGFASGIIIITTICFKSFNIGLSELSSKHFPRNYFNDPAKLLQWNEPFFNGKQKNVNGVKKDWHDYEFIAYEESRKGFGENGEPEKLSPEELPFHDELFYQNGYNALLSDKIALNRSVPDIRHRE